MQKLKLINKIKFMNEEQLKKMKIGEEKWIGGTTGVLRVVSGWIYSFYDPESDTITSSTFVPLNN